MFYKQGFFNDVRNDYLNRVWELSPNSKFISDKMPGNFFNLGLIYLAIPNAKIIHAMRDPMDSCFSNYTRLFNFSTCTYLHNSSFYFWNYI